MTIVPLFQMFLKLGWVNTHWPLVLIPVFGAPSVFATFVMRQFFIALPAELEEAARVDGLGRFTIFRTIALPLARPALASVAIFTFLHSWNLYLEPIVFLSTPSQVHAAAGADAVHRRLRRADVEHPAGRGHADGAAGADRLRAGAEAVRRRPGPHGAQGLSLHTRPHPWQKSSSPQSRNASAPSPVIHGLDLHIHDGEFVALVGPSGCGKSTLLRMIAGLEAVTQGRIHIGGRDVTDLDPKDRDIAMVFQNYALYPHMTVAANMGFSLEHRGRPKAEIAERVRWAADILGLAQLLDRYPRQLSGGQRQRVAMGRAIVRDPQVFLFDEPLSNLDAKLRIVMRGEIKGLHQRLKTTTVYVTHDQVEAMTMADRIVVLNAGRVEQVGSPLELFDRPANQFVAGFIGSPAMNFMPGRCTPQGFEAADVPAAAAGRR